MVVIYPTTVFHVVSILHEYGMFFMARKLIPIHDFN